MNTIALIFFIVAAVFFAIGSVTSHPRLSFTNCGALALTIGLIIQFAAKSHSITF